MESLNSKPGFQHNDPYPKTQYSSRGSCMFVSVPVGKDVRVRMDAFGCSDDDGDRRFESVDVGRGAAGTLCLLSRGSRCVSPSTAEWRVASEFATGDYGNGGGGIGGGTDGVRQCVRVCAALIPPSRYRNRYCRY